MNKFPVIVLHGLFCSSRIMRRVIGYLAKENFKVIPFNYPSRKKLVKDIVQDLYTFIQPIIASSEKIHFVVHSMGGIIVRQLLKDFPEMKEKVDRVVMLGTPNQGSELAELALHIPLGPWIGGKNIAFLSHKNNHLWSLPFPEETGVIAGTNAWYPWSSLVFKGPNDGLVAVERTKASGIKDWIECPTTHRGLLFNRDVLGQIVRFLTTGKFAR